MNVINNYTLRYIYLQVNECTKHVCQLASVIPNRESINKE